MLIKNDKFIKESLKHSFIAIFLPPKNISRNIYVVYLICNNINIVNIDILGLGRVDTRNNKLFFRQPTYSSCF